MNLLNFKVGFVLGSSVFSLYFWQTKSPTDAKPRDVSSYTAKKHKKMKIIKWILLSAIVLLIFGFSLNYFKTKSTKKGRESFEKVPEVLLLSARNLILSNKLKS